ncbi:EEF1A lysine methyltransferase 2 [Phlebotomus papatasi]|uniref:Protein-lysine N-methyltransferase n=1 Tax=Phlebotomus papatasi TaxID=29031 RepID=A0A1B0CZP0_PHLPP|nr:EEF1A lysine methyltransferase 2 [Phlebotomus papatasi]
MSQEIQKDQINNSELGTKEFWDRSYSLEIQNYKNHGDVGEIWFNEYSQVRVIKWIKNSSGLSQEKRILDIGCGNGMMLVELAKEGFQNLLGVDYSQQAIDLARSIAKDQKLNSMRIEYQPLDILVTEEVDKLGKFGITHDKGTYDAICMCPENPTTKREKYLENIYNLTEDGGFFIITSCNWTEDELKETFSKKFQLKLVLPTATFKFGGKIGNVVTTIVFQKTLK